jgi:hypothetical protein
METCACLLQYVPLRLRLTTVLEDRELETQPLPSDWTVVLSALSGSARRLINGKS